jgi:hypothetical protein
MGVISTHSSAGIHICHPHDRIDQGIRERDRDIYREEEERTRDTYTHTDRERKRERAKLKNCMHIHVLQNLHFIMLDHCTPD